MKKNRPISMPAIGGSSLLVIFAVLCMTVFALLSLSTAQAERRMSDAAAQAAKDYYAADLQAQKIYAQLRAGGQTDGVEREGDTFRYSCAISERQTLCVELENKEGTWRVLRWRVVAEAEPADDALPVWDGIHVP